MRLFRVLLLAVLVMTLCAPRVCAADLSVYSFTGPATAASGASITYTLQVMNGGTETTNAKVAVRLDPNVTYSSVTAPTGWTCTNPGSGQSGTVTCTNSTFRTTKFWIASEAVALNDVRFPTTPNGHLYKCTTAGTTGSTEPTWPTGTGATVTDGTVVWTETGTDSFTVGATVTSGTALWTWLNTYATVSFTPTSTSPPDPNPENDRVTVSTRVNG